MTKKKKRPPRLKDSLPAVTSCSVLESQGVSDCLARNATGTRSSNVQDSKKRNLLTFAFDYKAKLIGSRIFRKRLLHRYNILMNYRYQSSSLHKMHSDSSKALMSRYSIRPVIPRCTELVATHDRYCQSTALFELADYSIGTPVVQFFKTEVCEVGAVTKMNYSRVTSGNREILFVIFKFLIEHLIATQLKNENELLKANLKLIKLVNRNERCKCASFCLCEVVALCSAVSSPLDLVVRFVNSKSWVMEADEWADLLIVCCWANPTTIRREDVLCTICNGVWEQPVTIHSCEHVFCRRCLKDKGSDLKECPECGHEVKEINLDSRLANTLLESYKTDRYVSIEDMKRHCEHVGVHCALQTSQDLAIQPRVKRLRNEDEDDEIPDVKRIRVTSNVSVQGCDLPLLAVDSHLLQVKEVIWDVRSQWRDIGRGLGLTEGDICAIHEDNDGERLHQVLAQWMKTDKATLNSLVKTLNSTFVQRYDIAREVTKLHFE